MAPIIGQIAGGTQQAASTAAQAASPFPLPPVLPSSPSVSGRFRQLTQAFVDNPTTTFAGLRGGAEFFSVLAENRAREDQRRVLEARGRGARAELKAFDLQNLARQREVGERARLQSFQRQRQGLRERGSIRARAAETGLLGRTPLRQLNQSLFNEGFDIDTISANREGRIAQSLAERGGVASRTEARLLGLQAQAEGLRPISPFIAGLRIAGAGLQGGLQGEQIRQQRRQFRDI